jgi:FkbM family methyltransferase
MQREAAGGVGGGHPRSRASVLGEGRASRAVRALHLRWLELRYGRQGLPWHIHGEAIRINPHVRHLLPSTAEPALFDYLRRTVRPGDVVLDVGGFLGAYAILSARWAGPSGRVVTFEPTAWTAGIAREHFRMNPEGDRIALVEAAVSDRAGRARFAAFDKAYRNQIVGGEPEGSNHAHDHQRQHYSVATVTIDEVCGEMGLRPTLIRMDVQGAEFAALEGARRTIQDGRGRLRLVVEMHPQLWPSFGVRPEEAETRLASLGLKAAALEGDDPFASDDHAELTFAGVNG